MTTIFDQASHCFAFEFDFIGTWRCIPLCVRRKLDLIGLKLKLSHWLEFSYQQRQQLVDWPDAAIALEELRQYLRICTGKMVDGEAVSFSPARGEAWQNSGLIPELLIEAAVGRQIVLDLDRWALLSELERFALCKLVRSGHDHHNLTAAFIEMLA